MPETLHDVLIRPYHAADRQAIRTIAADTADRGEPGERLFRDRELFADLVTSYYTDHDPDATWVAEHQGRVIGYLTGCLDSRRYRRAMARRIVPRVVLKAIGRGALGSWHTWRWLVAAWQTWRAGGFQRRVPLDRFPAHLHINISHRFRGRQLGRTLVERFIEQSRHAGVPGVHAAVRSDNAVSCRFFERLGFWPMRRCPVTFPDNGGYATHDTVIYAKPLTS